MKLPIPFSPAADDGTPDVDLGGIRIMLCECNPVNSALISLLLVKWGLTVDLAEDGRKALDMFAASVEGYYQALVMNLQLPVLDGLRVLDSLRKSERFDARSVPVLALSAEPDEDKREVLLSNGFSSCLPLPIEPARLLKSLKLIFAKKQEQ